MVTLVSEVTVTRANSLLSQMRIFCCPKYRCGVQATFASGLALALLAVVLACSGCAPSALSSVRQKIAAGQYAAARQELLGLQAHPEELGESEMREVKDDLCLSEFMIGAPTYSFTEQRRICVDGAREPESQSGQLVAKINACIRKAASEKVEAALQSGDLADAEQAAIAYLETPDSDPMVLASWSRKMWTIVNAQDQRAEAHRKKAVAPAIEEIRKHYPALKSMSKRDFQQWVAKQGTVGGTRMLSALALKDDKVNLLIHSDDLHTAALNLDRFATINDGIVARCGCDGGTDVGIAETNFPLYLVRLDPETRRSEVLILPHR